MAAAGVTPVTVLTGFLGSGKTTLLRQLLQDARWRDSAVIVNEWGEAGLDHAIVREASDNVVLLPSGCLCCRVAGDLVRALRELHVGRIEGRVPRFSRVVVETSGLADPGPILATLAGMAMVAARYAPSGIVTTVDAEHGEAQLARHREARSQVALADRLVVTKSDRVDAARLVSVERAIRSLNPAAPLVRSRPGGPVPPDLLEPGLYRAGSRGPDATGWLRAGAYRPMGAAAAHDGDIESFAWSAKEPFERGDLETALEAIVRATGERLMRLKGLVNVRGEPGPWAVHAVGHTLYPFARLAAWPDADRASRIVFIGRGLEEPPIASILESFLQR